VATPNVMRDGCLFPLPWSLYSHITGLGSNQLAGNQLSIWAEQSNSRRFQGWRAVNNLIIQVWTHEGDAKAGHRAQDEDEA